MLSALMANELDYVTILPFIAGAAIRGLPVRIVAATTRASGYAIVARPEIDGIKALKGKRIAINSFGSSADFAIYQLLRRNGLDPNKDVTLQAIAGSPDARFAALIGGSVEATVVGSPFEYRAEQKGFKTLLSVKETAEFVRIPITGLSTTLRKIEKEPEEIVRMLRALRGAIAFSPKPTRNRRRLAGKAPATRPRRRRALLHDLPRAIQFRPHGAGLRCRRVDRRGNVSSQGQAGGQTAGRLRLDVCGKSQKIKPTRGSRLTPLITPGSQNRIYCT